MRLLRLRSGSSTWRGMTDEERAEMYAGGIARLTATRLSKTAE